MKVVLDWLTTESNYARPKGDDRSSGLTKRALCGITLGKLIHACIKHRKPASVRNKIWKLEAKPNMSLDISDIKNT
ncbi:hypothetical protein F441_00989, partial [Phytophthora nicotianae CJ01A1]